MNNNERFDDDPPNQHDEFQSMSGKSSDIDQEVKQVEMNRFKNFNMTQIQFPQLDPKTLRLYSMYQQNTTLINSLKQQINRLQHIKKQSLCLQQQPPKQAIETSVSQFFLSCQQTYEKRQLELLNLKKDIKTFDTQQVRILMARNDNIKNLSETYFGEFKKIIDAKTYEEGLILLTQQKKKSKKKKEVIVQDLLSKMSIESEDNTAKNSSGIRGKHLEKIKIKYMVRFVNYSELFSDFGNNKSSLSDKMHYIIPVSVDQIPISLAYSHILKLVLVLMKCGRILAYSSSDNQNSLSDHQSSHKTEHIHIRLNQIPGVKIQLDTRVRVIWLEIRETKLFLLTSDSLLRIYDIIMTSKKLNTIKIVNIVYCQSRDKELGEIVGMSFSKISPEELLFITKNHHLCKMSLKNLKSQLLYTYNQDLIQVHPFYLEASDKIFFSTQNFDPIETKLIDKSKLVSSEGSNKKLLQQRNIKVLCLQKGQKIYVSRIQPHGLLTGIEIDLEQMSPQVEIIQSIIQEE